MQFPGVKLICNTENKGFGAANNQALAVAQGEYVLFLNPDTLIPEDCIDRCVDFLASHDDDGALGVRMIDGSGRFLKESKRAFPDPMTSFYKLTGLTALRPRSKVFARYYLGHLDEKENHEVDVLAGAFMMLPRKVLNKVKGFDEDFFMYGEDIDLSFRIQKAGFVNYYFAGSTIIHFKGESTRKGSLNYVKMFYKAMSIFVKKHYGSSRAGLFNIFIQGGIFLRGAFSAISQFLRWVGMPVIDLLTILFSFWIVKQAWVIWLLPYLAYDNKILLITYPAYALLFLITSYYSGLYDNGYMQSRLNKSVLISTLTLFTIYALIPESDQFSRGVLLTSVLLAYVMLTGVRAALTSMKIISRKTQSKTERIAIAGTPEQAEEVTDILDHFGLKENILGRIAVGNAHENTLSDWQSLPRLLQSGVIDELIYCQGRVTFKEIISSVEGLPADVRAGFFACGSSGIIGSWNKNFSGEYRSAGTYYRLQNALYRRVKRLFDFTAAALFLFSFPIHLFIKKEPLRFFQNTIQVLFNKKSFVGYATAEPGLPDLKPSVLSATGLPRSKNQLPEDALRRADTLYAREYSVFTDLGLVYKGYKYLHE